jgi:hypothetical protein
MDTQIFENEATLLPGNIKIHNNVLQKNGILRNKVAWNLEMLL